ncbi:MAG TPA: winged helix-turn-helix domain-containing protein [Acidobacteriaceae bacterium]|nr:winged helix-turn-helix domain-containing protein [Acidobacteriaceae bacterium]
MSTPNQSERRISTGLFEVDLVSGEVLREGRVVPVQEQPFRVLRLLLERPGQVVTREELQSKLWPADTYVSFDQGLNTAIRKLRVLLGDSADNPRYIETIPKRGYRFIAPVRALGESKPPAQSQAQPEKAAQEGRKGVWIRAGWIAALSVLMAVGAIFATRAILQRRSHGSQATPPAGRAMLVALPFQNLTDDPAQEYFSDGLTEETITDLGELSPAHLGVIARTSSMAYKHTNKTIEQIGLELHANYVLEGSVRRENGRVRITAQLIRVSDQTHLWAQSYDVRNLGDLIDVQSAIGRAIAEQVQVQVAPEYGADSVQLHAQNPVAYDLYLQGRFYWNQRTAPALRKSIELFRQAVAADPNSPLAWAGLADAYNISNIIGALSSRQSSPQARTAATRALELDPSLADAHAALAMEKSHYEFDFPGARAEFQKATQLNPNSAYAHLFYSGAYLMPMGLRTEAIAEMQKAVELDPLSLPINNFLGETYVLAGDYPAAYRQYQHTIAMNPNFPLVHAYLADLFELTGKYEDAVHEREKTAVLSGASEQESMDKAVRLTKALKSGGAAGFWKELVSQDLRARQSFAGGFDVIAQDYALAGEKDLAFQWLEKSIAAREGQELTLLAVDPMWNNLHGDPRYVSLLHRIGLPEGVEVHPSN